MQIGAQKSQRFLVSVDEEVLLAQQEEAEDAAELASFFDYDGGDEEDEPLNSPFAVRQNPTPEELREMRDVAWFHDPATYDYDDGGFESLVRTHPPATW